MLSHDGMKFTKQIIMNIYFDKDIFLFKEEKLKEIIKDEMIVHRHYESSNFRLLLNHGKISLIRT